MKSRIETLLETANACVQAEMNISNFLCCENLGFVLSPNGIFYLGFYAKENADKTKYIFMTNGDVPSVKRCYKYNNVTASYAGLDTGSYFRPVESTHMLKFFEEYNAFEEQFYAYVDEIVK